MNTEKKHEKTQTDSFSFFNLCLSLFICGCFSFCGLIPESKGGGSDFDNLCFCCFWCNNYKQAQNDVVQQAGEDRVFAHSRFHCSSRALQHVVGRRSAAWNCGLILTGEADTIRLRVRRGQSTRQDVLRRQAAFEDDGQRRCPPIEFSQCHRDLDVRDGDATASPANISRIVITSLQAN